MHKYPTNLTDKQWQVIKNMLDLYRHTLFSDTTFVIRENS